MEVPVPQIATFWSIYYEQLVVNCFPCCIILCLHLHLHLPAGPRKNEDIFVLHMNTWLFNIHCISINYSYIYIDTFTIADVCLNMGVIASIVL